MKTVSISGSTRENVGKKDAKLLRNNGRVPCVLYGGKEQIHFSVEEKDFKNIIYTPEVCFVNININSNDYRAIVQEAQFHPVTERMLHVDFVELVPQKLITMKIPVKLIGVAPGVLKGGKIATKLKKLKIKASPEFMPDFVNVDISTLDIGNNVKVNDIKIENLELLDPKNTVVVGVYVTRAAVSEAATEAATADKTAAAK